MEKTTEEKRARIREYYQRPEVKARKKAYRQRPEIIAKMKARRDKQTPEIKEKTAKRQKEWNKNNPEKGKEYAEKWRRLNKLRKNIINKKWRDNNQKHIANYSKKYLIENREEIMKYHKIYLKEKGKKDIQFAIGLRLRNRMRKVIRDYIENRKLPKGYGYKGINYKEVCKHLMKTVPINWQQYHIDHIIPVCSFDLTDKEELEKLNHYSNLQWLPARENQIKGGK